MEERNQLSNEWGSLLRITGVLTLIMLVLIPIQILVLSFFPMPQTNGDWIQLFINNPLLGLIHMDVLYLINIVILSVLYLGLTVLLMKKNRSLSLLALLLGVVGIAAYFASNKSVEMFFLTRNIPAGVDGNTLESLKQTVQVLLLEWRGTAFTVYYFLNAFALLLYSLVMLKSPLFTKGTAMLGLVSAILMAVPSTFGMIGMIFSLLSLIPWYVFCIKIVRVFLHRT